MSKRAYDNYFKSKKHDIKKDLVNTFMLYESDNKCHFIMSNGYSIIMVNSMYLDYVENNKYKVYLIRTFETFSDKNWETYDYIEKHENNIDLINYISEYWEIEIVEFDENNQEHLELKRERETW